MGYLIIFLVPIGALLFRAAQGVKTTSRQSVQNYRKATEDYNAPRRGQRSPNTPPYDPVRDARSPRYDPRTDPGSDLYDPRRRT